jgi:DNA helicase II / ATP-dependent DNA helicase PcrA
MSDGVKHSDGESSSASIAALIARLQSRQPQSMRSTEPPPAAAATVRARGPVVAPPIRSSERRQDSDVLLEGLNPPQREAVQHTEGPLLILAGAGSGKTRVITRRIAYLIQRHHVDPAQILSVTFTKKAAKEMRSRVQQLLGGTTAGVTLGTFHALCARILRAESAAAGLRPQWVIYDEGDQLSALKDASTGVTVGTGTVDPRTVLARISLAKNALRTPEQAAEAATGFAEEVFARLYALYQERLRAANAVDFDDLLMQVVLLFRKDDASLRKYQDTWRFVQVDEYQDTNAAQYELVHLLSRRHGNLCVVGDDDQAIYAWRGANLRNILEFEQDHPDCTVIKLEANYRSTQAILEGAGGLVRHNVSRKDKTVRSTRGPGSPIQLHYVEDERAEAELVAKTIEASRGVGFHLRDIAVLYRVNVQSRALEEGLRRLRIPYEIIGGLRFYDRREIKDAIAYLRLIANPLDNQSFRRIANVPARGIGDASLLKLDEAAAKAPCSLLEACARPECQAELPPKTRAALQAFARLIEDFHTDTDQGALPKFIRKVLTRTGYWGAWAAQRDKEAEDRLDNLGELITAAEEFEADNRTATLTGFLDTVSLMSNLDEKTSGASVTLMTLHAAKGLEFPLVLMTGLEDGILPHERALSEGVAGLEEERRLCYVGMTRAMDQLVLSSARTRKLYQKPAPKIPSRFLAEIPPEVLETTGAPGALPRPSDALAAALGHNPTPKPPGKPPRPRAGRRRQRRA